jgi:hypothetical protein
VPAPRVCRSCGAAIGPDIRWCTKCYAAVTEFAPRETTQGGVVGMPRHDVRYSRWAAGPLTFGPVGRLAATACVIALGPWSVFGSIAFANPFFIWYLGAYTIAATLVLKHVWARVAVPPSSREPRSPRPSRLIGRYPWLATPVAPPRFVVLGGLALVAIAILAVAWLYGDTQARYGLAFVGVVLGAGTLTAWLAGI